MKNITWVINGIKGLINTMATNWKTMLAGLSILAAGVFISQMWFKSKGGNNKIIETSLRACETDRTTMLQAIMKWQDDLSKDDNNHSFNLMNTDFHTASYIIFDTIPKQQMKIIREMDSLIKKMKADSIKRANKQS